jgi:uncharacterized protein (TIGR02246 family)
MQGPWDETAIRVIEESYNDAWNHHDAAAMVASMTPDAQFISVAGVWNRSSEEFLQLQRMLQADQFKDSVRETSQVEIRFLSLEIAIVITRFSVAGDRDPSGTPRSPRQGIGTRVVQKQSGI